MNPSHENFILALSRAREPEMLSETLLSGLSYLYALPEISCIDFLDNSDDSRCEQVISLKISDHDSANSNEIWDRVPRMITPDPGSVARARAGEVHIIPSPDGEYGIIPLSSGGEITGMLKFLAGDEINPNTNEIRFFARIFANLHKNLDLAQRDKLTGLLNRQTFDSKLSRMLEIQRSLAQSYSRSPQERRKTKDQKLPWLAIIDIDFFKRVNDEFGHLYGDEVILTLGQKIKQCFRRTDLLFRFGGEEFVVVLEPIIAENVSIALERFRQQIENHRFPQVGQVTVSIGYAAFIENAFAPRIMDNADQALYYAKEHGRNQIANYETLIQTGDLLQTERSEGAIDLF